MLIGSYKWYEYALGYIFIGICVFLVAWGLIAIIRSFWNY